MKDSNLILENIVYLELLRRGYTITVSRNKEDKEIDFICHKQGKKNLYPSSLLHKKPFNVNSQYITRLVTTFQNMFFP